MIRVAVATSVLAGCLFAADVAPPCGNGRLDQFETCDDGNIAGGDGCSANCEREPACGDGVIDLGELCDDGNTVGGDGCTAGCWIETTCGNTLVEVGEDCDEGDLDPSDGCSAMCLFETRYPITVRWTFASLATPTIDEGCPPGAETVELRMQAVRANGTALGDEIVETVACSAGEAVVSRFQGLYAVSLTVRGISSTYAATPVTVVDTRLGPRTFAPTIYDDAGFADVHWTIVDASSNAVGCGGAGGVDAVALHVVVDGVARETVTPCIYGRGSSPPLPAGVYALTVLALDEQGSQLAEVVLPSVTITAPNGVAVTGIELPVRR